MNHKIAFEILKVTHAVKNMNILISARVANL